ALKEFRSLSPIYEEMSDKALEERYYEEYLADRFDAWKMNIKTPTNPQHKSLFRRIIDWIRNLINGSSKTELYSLFERIDSGKYKNAKLQDNRFTREVEQSVTEPVLKVIKIG